MYKVPECFRSTLIGCSLGVFVFLLDQLSKYWVVCCIPYLNSVEVSHFFNIVHIVNFGLTFGILSSLISKSTLIIVFVIVLICFCIAFWCWNRKYYILPGALVISGALSNACDRLVYNGVVDFLDFHIAGLHWPAFNFADCAIVVGVSILFFLEQSTEKILWGKK